MKLVIRPQPSPDGSEGVPEAAPKFGQTPVLGITAGDQLAQALQMLDRAHSRAKENGPGLSPHQQRMVHRSATKLKAVSLFARRGLGSRQNSQSSMEQRPKVKIEQDIIPDKTR